MLEFLLLISLSLVGVFIVAGLFILVYEKLTARDQATKALNEALENRENK